MLEGEHGEKFRDELYLIFDEFVRGIKNEKYKLIEYRNGDKDEDKFTFLYDLQNDPWEITNLATDEKYRDVIIEMRNRMLAHRDSWQEQQHEWGTVFWERFNAQTDNL